MPPISNPRRISCALPYSRSVRHIGREFCKLFARHSTRPTHRFLALNSECITRLQPPPEGKKRTAFRCTMSGVLNFDRETMRTAEVIADFRRYYPRLERVAITHDWSGPIDRTPDSLPLIGYLGGRKNICYGIGWSGNGVGPSVVGGKILASLALEKNNQWSQYPLVGRRAESFPPEPIRFIGAHLVRAAVASKEKAEIEDRKPSPLAVRVSRFAPGGLEDK